MHTLRSTRSAARPLALTLAALATLALTACAGVPVPTERMAVAQASVQRANTATTIEGYTDSVGNAQANYLVSELRARAVMGELVKLGVAPDHMTVRAHGADEPVASNGTAAGRQATEPPCRDPVHAAG